MSPADLPALVTSSVAAAKAARPRGGSRSSSAAHKQLESVVKVRGGHANSVQLGLQGACACCSGLHPATSAAQPLTAIHCLLLTLARPQVGGLPQGITAPEVLGLFWGWAAKPDGTHILPAGDGAPHAEVR